MPKACAVCNSSNVQFKCNRCGKDYCFNHTGSTDEFYCSTHNTSQVQLILDRQTAGVQDGRCMVVENGKCPLCGSWIVMQKLPSGQFYLECIRRDWNSNQNSPILVYPNEKNLLREAEKLGIAPRGKVCGDKLKRNKGREFCNQCLLDLIRSNTQTPFSTLQAQFGLSPKEIEQILSKLMLEKTIQGILDAKQQIFIYLDSSKEAQLVAELQSAGFMDLDEIQRKLSVHREVAQRIIIELIRKNNFRGTFTQSRSRYYLESGLNQILMKEINEHGRIEHQELAQQLDVMEGNIKNFIMNLLKNKFINAYFADNGRVTVLVDQLEREIQDYCAANGIFFVTAIASQLKIAPELARKTIFTLIQKGSIRGVFSQNHEFITEETLSERIHAIARAFRKITLVDLAQKLAITENKVEDVLTSLISRGVINGYIDMAKREFVAEAVQPASYPSPYQTGSETPKAPGAAPSTVPKPQGKVEVLRQYDFVGGQLHFKVVVKNLTNMAIHDIKVILDVPSSYRRTQEMITISVIDPNNTHGVDFYLEPAECGVSSLGGTVLYKDAMGQYNTIYIEKKDVQIKCPLVIKTLDTIEDCQKAIQSLPTDARAFLIADLSPQMAYSAAYRAISQFDTHAVISYESKEEPYEAEAWFSSEAKVTGGRIITRIFYSGQNNNLEIRVWCNDPGQLTGFLAKIIELLFAEINMMRNIKAEERNKTVEAMAVTRAIYEIKDICMLRYKASSARLKLEDIHVRLSRTLGDGHEIQLKVDNWIKKLNEYGADDNLKDEDADNLEKELDLIDQSLHRIFGK